MPKNKKGLLIVLSGPSGAGKDSVLREVMAQRSDLKLSVSCTTRNPREGEINGKDYHFINKDEFLARANSGEMLEYANYCENYYGTPKSEVEKYLSQGTDVILEIEVQGAMQIIEKCPDAISIFIVAPSLKILRERLENRGLDTAEVIEKRVRKAEKEITCINNYNYILINDNINKCAKDVIKIIDAENMRVCKNEHIVKEVLKK